MAHDDRACEALSLVLAVVGPIAITKAGIDARDGVVRWPTFSLAAGLAINTPEGKPTVFLLTASALAGLGLVVTLVCLALLRDGVLPALSGVRIDLSTRPYYGATLMAGLWLGSSLSVLACSFSRPLTLSLMHDALALRLSQASRVEKPLRLFVAIGSAVGLLIYSIL